MKPSDSHHVASEPRLITLVLSPYNELARWSLERAGVAYREDRKALVQQVFASRLAGGGGTTPVLVADGEVISESAEIAEWADRHRAPGRPPLYPEGKADEARRLVARFGEDLGVAARRVIWGHLIEDIDLACRSWGQGLSDPQRRAQPWLLRASKPMVRRALGLRASQVEAAPDQVRAVFDEVAERLSDGRAHLLGQDFSVADISFASMASPAVCPPEGYPGRMPQPDDFPESYASTIRELRAHPAGEYALRLYRETRLADRG